MRRAALAALLLPTPAAAHVGHLGDVAGHDHWVAGAALGAAALAALWGARKGRAGKEGDAAAAGEPAGAAPQAEPEAGS